MQFNVMMNQLKLNALMLLESEIYVIKGSKCCFTDYCQSI